MRILWHSVPPLIPTGYGTQTKIMLRLLRNMGHDVALSCSTGMTGTTIMWEGIKVFPESGHITRYGMDVVALHAKHWKADVVWSWVDAFVIPEAEAKKLNWFAWAPIDSDPVMVRNVKPLQACKWTAAPSRWGVRMLNDAGFKDAEFLPCMHDPAVFYPMDKGEARTQFSKPINRDLAGKFLVNVVSANSSDRKNYPAIFEAWKKFSDAHSDALLYIHADMTGYFSAGSDLVEMAKLYKCNPDSVVFVSQWEYITGQIGEDYLNLLYNASDLHLNCCFGEGFGLPIMDAQAAGCPTLVPAFSASNEVGLCFKVSRGRMMHTVPGAFQFLVDPEAVADKLDQVYYSKIGDEERRRISQAANPWRIENVRQEHLAPLLKRLERDLK